MNSIFCWYCGRPFDYGGKKYKDVTCPHCKVLNSIYNPDKPDFQPENQTTEDMWLNEGGEMIDYGQEKYQSKFIYLPKVGETLIVEIRELREVKSDNPRFNFTENVPVMANGEQVVDDDGEPVFKKKDLGYHVEAELENGKILSITSMAAFLNVFKKHEIQDGDKIKISHPEKGVWEVEEL